MRLFGGVISPPFCGLSNEFSKGDVVAVIAAQATHTATRAQANCRALLFDPV